MDEKELNQARKAYSSKKAHGRYRRIGLKADKKRRIIKNMREIYYKTGRMFI